MLFSKYERTKQVATELKEREDRMEQDRQTLTESLKMQEARYDKMKAHAMSQLEMWVSRLIANPQQSSDEPSTFISELTIHWLRSIALTDLNLQSWRLNSKRKNCWERQSTNNSYRRRKRIPSSLKFVMNSSMEVRAKLLLLLFSKMLSDFSTQSQTTQNIIINFLSLFLLLS